jgi:hypothetical protein
MGAPILLLEGTGPGVVAGGFYFFTLDPLDGHFFWLDFK